MLDPGAEKAAMVSFVFFMVSCVFFFAVLTPKENNNNNINNVLFSPYLGSGKIWLKSVNKILIQALLGSKCSLRTNLHFEHKALWHKMLLKEEFA